MTHRGASLSVALADAMLAGKWTVGSMIGRVRRVAGHHHRWLADLVIEVLSFYPRPPADRPRELAAMVAETAALRRASSGARRRHLPPPGPARRIAEPTRTMNRPFGTPRLDNAADLAEYLEVTMPDLVRFADTDHRTRRTGDGKLRHYRYRWLERRSGPRLLEAPRPRLAALQRRILDGILTPIPVHPAVHGFVRGLSAASGARIHCGASVVMSLDLESFFAAITAGRVWGVLRAAGFPEPTAHLLTGLLTHAAPVSVLRAMPAGVDPSRSFRLRRRLAAAHLPQGAPSSPQLANLVAWSLDRRLAGYAAAVGAQYTRYADDLTLSGGPVLARRAGPVVSAVSKMVQQEGFRLNAGKTRIRQGYQRQLVTGIVVNGGLNVPRPDYDRLRAILHDCARNGPDAANRAGHTDFRAYLLGRIAWVGGLNPDRGRRLRSMFDEISWG